MALSDVLLKKLSKHSKLDPTDKEAIRQFSCKLRELASGEDFLRQGDKPTASAVVLEGVVARYHTLGSGRRQYLSVHFPGDWPDAQGLFIDRMDHSVCAIGKAVLCAIPHEELIAAFRRHPSVSFAIWRETLIDAAIFREAITNNGSRSATVRVAHFFAEAHYRMNMVGLCKEGVCELPFSQTQLGELLGLSLVSISRSLAELRGAGAVDFAFGRLSIHDPEAIARRGDFDPTYLHDGRQPNR
jgi:CRP-like cAMP-binding protein